jgi:geranylgeranyl pyrophosphate synthase
MTQPALAFYELPHLLTALGRELDRDVSAPLGSDAAKHVSPRAWDGAIGGALREFLQRPGKEFRGELTKTFFAMFNDSEIPHNLPLVVEALHAGSLIVDDIQDDSPQRRGKLALHRLCGLPVALNAGNWLYFWAAELLGDVGLNDRQRVQAHTLFNRCLLDSHYGQALDLSQRASCLSRDELPVIVKATTELKSGSLLALAAALGALVGGASDQLVRSCHRFGRDMGSALQMLDDLSGVLSPRKLGKGEEDLRNDRPTWIWAWLAESQTSEQFERFRKMGAAIAEGGEPLLFIAELRGLLKGHKRVVHDHLEAALGRLQDELPDSTNMNGLRLALERLEGSYV